MHGLIGKTLQSFARDTYGAQVWSAVVRRAELGFEDFEAMLTYEADAGERALEALCAEVGLPREAVLEDIGTYLVSHANTEAVRRLLRFGGESFVEFLHSLDELPDRARLAVDDLALPQLELCAYSADHYRLDVTGPISGFGAVLMGVLRGMADDYGALVFLEYGGRSKDVEAVEIQLIETEFAKGRGFDLGVRAE